MGLIKNYDAPIIPGSHFTWREYATLQMWGKLADPTKQQYQNAILLFNHIEECIRIPYRKRLIIKSGARTAAYVAYLRAHKIPAATHGAHNTWEAVDLAPYPGDMSTSAFWHFCDKHWPGRMELLAYTPGWSHLDIRQWGQRIRFKP